MDGPRSTYRHADCTLVELDDRISIFHAPTQTVHALSASATAVWRQFNETGDISAAISGVARIYGVPVEHIEADVVDVVRSFVEAGLLLQENTGAA